MPDMNPLCQECDEPETTEHALLQCTTLEMERLELTQGIPVPPTTLKINTKRGKKPGNESQRRWRPLPTPQHHEQKNGEEGGG
ncbi:Uncharacterized protein APZ42_001838 [Daphnia magna]|uniref:Uncharacterized protein n=1 Tax=Daphnia magna TaxID=35525 RepID=A0A164IPU4_9CRUS|nr:Uncharacterized protein APZ42_001838 [Daphnia magna]